MSWRLILRWVVAWAPAAFFTIMATERRWISDDGFINLRIVRNLLAGDGPVYNVGERVEAATSSLFIFLVALGGLTGATLEYVAIALGVAASSAGLALVTWVHLRRAKSDAIVFPVGVFIFASIPVAWDFATAGLETGLALLWIAGAWAGLDHLLHGEREIRSRELSFVALWLSLAPLVRPELTLISLLGGLALLVRCRRNLRAVALLLICLALVPVSYQIFRMGYFGIWVPNTAVAKSAFGGNWEQGEVFASNLVDTYRLLIPLALVLVLFLWGLRRAPRFGARTIVVVGGVLYGLYVVRLGGGFMHGRLLLPPLACFCLVSPAIAIPKFELSPKTGVSALLMAGVLAWCVCAAAMFRHPTENQGHIGDERAWYSRMAGVDNPVLLAHYSTFHFYLDADFIRDETERVCPDEGPECQRNIWMEDVFGGPLSPHLFRRPIAREKVAPGVDAVVIRVAMGILGYRLDNRVHLVDYVGLTDPLAARMEVQVRGRPGHERWLPAPWYAARFAAPIPHEDPRVTTARAALGCGQLAELIEATSAPLTLDLFMRNIERSLRLTRLRIPIDPSVARAEHCGAP